MVQLLLLLLLCGTTTSSSLSSAPLASSCAPVNINLEQLDYDIRHGRVHQVHDFLTEEEALLLLREMDDLEFKVSGLSNTVKGKDQGFGSNDRLLSIVPWWHRVIDHAPTSETTTSSTDQDLPSHMVKLRQLLSLLATTFNRPTILEQTHECYYSKSLPNSMLDRHMDERHEELKGRLGWLQPSRRSISWLIYLSDEGWDIETNGGALQYMTSPSKPTGQGCTHQGNLQIGWWTARTTSFGSKEKEFMSSQPVYLNSWFPFAPSNDEDIPSTPHCILYIVDENGNIQYLTHPWPNDDATGLSTSEFILRYEKELFLSHPEPSSSDPPVFSLLENRQAWKMQQGDYVLEKVTPTRRSLVLFDSVVVPHEVAVIHSGTRRALAGWFHEATQSIPEEWL